jgi:uncharacterized membrane protein HdeD (DUF308 family)
MGGNQQGFEIAAAVRLRKVIQGEWVLALAGVLSIVFGIARWVAPIAGTVMLTWWIGVYVLLAGVVQLVLAFRLRRWQLESLSAFKDEMRVA